MNIQALAISLVVALVVGFGAGWTVNGWRFSQVEADLGVCRGNTAALEIAIKDQNNHIQKLKDKSKVLQDAAERAHKAAQGEISRLRQSNELIRKSSGESCEDAEKLINEALGL